jgi:hypothetical protein
MQLQKLHWQSHDMFFTKCRKPVKYCNTFFKNIIAQYKANVKQNCIKGALGKVSFFAKSDPLPTLSDMRVGNNFKKIFFLQKKHCNLRLLHV